MAAMVMVSMFTKLAFAFLLGVNICYATRGLLGTMDVGEDHGTRVSNYGNGVYECGGGASGGASGGGSWAGRWFGYGGYGGGGGGARGGGFAYGGGGGGGGGYAP